VPDRGLEVGGEAQVEGVAVTRGGRQRAKGRVQQQRVDADGLAAAQVAARGEVGCPSGHVLWGSLRAEAEAELPGDVAGVGEVAAAAEPGEGLEVAEAGEPAAGLVGVGVGGGEAGEATAPGGEASAVDVQLPAVGLPRRGGAVGVEPGAQQRGGVGEVEQKFAEQREGGLVRGGESGVRAGGAGLADQRGEQLGAAGERRAGALQVAQGA
jgi:hypothetical protein